MTRNPVYKEIGSIIRTKRKKLGLKQKNLAATLRISRGSLANIETGRQNMLVHQLYDFASALHLSPHDLLPLSVENSSKVDRTELPLPDNLKGTQKEQVARFFFESSTKPVEGKELNHVNRRK